MGRHIFDASTRLDDPDPLQQPGVVLLDRPDVWCKAGRQPHRTHAARYLWRATDSAANPNW